MVHLYIVFFGVLAVLIAESVLLAAWSPAYLRLRLVVLVARIPASPRGSTPPSVGEIEAKVTAEVGGPPMVFHSIEGGLQAFRERFFSFRIVQATPVMWGAIAYDFPGQVVLVRGYVYWSLVAFVVCWYTFLISFAMSSPVPSVWLFSIVPVPLILLLYGLQVRRFRRIGKAAAALWSRK